MKQTQKGVSMVSLVITIIVIIILAAVAFSGSQETIGRAGFSGYVTDIDSVRTAFITEGVTSLMGEEETRNNTVTKAQSYNYLARGITTSSFSEEEKEGAWLSKAQANAIPCTRIEKEYAKEAIGIELPKRKVNTHGASGIEIEYFVTNKGDIFTWPPYLKSDDGLFYVNDVTTVAGSKVTSGDWIISGDDESKMYEDGFSFIVNGVEIKIQGTGEAAPSVNPDMTVEELRNMASVSYKDERNAETPKGVEFSNDGSGSAALNPDDGSTPVDGEVYKYGDYTYTYKASNDGWKVALNLEVTDRNQTSYGAILESINGKDIKDMSDTFLWCSKMLEAPQIPDSVMYMYQTFCRCSSLTSIPSLPSDVIDLELTFYDCKALTVVPLIPNKVIKMNGTFWNCRNLINISQIPNSVTNIEAAFCDCISLISLPEIPQGVTNFDDAFMGCINLTGTITINANLIETYITCFCEVDFEAQNITLAGTSSMLDELGATGENYCPECNGKCFGGH